MINFLQGGQDEKTIYCIVSAVRFFAGRNIVFLHNVHIDKKGENFGGKQ